MKPLDADPELAAHIYANGPWSYQPYALASAHWSLRHPMGCYERLMWCWCGRTTIEPHELMKEGEK